MVGVLIESPGHQAKFQQVRQGMQSPGLNAKTKMGNVSAILFNGHWE